MRRVIETLFRELLQFYRNTNQNKNKQKIKEFSVRDNNFALRKSDLEKLDNWRDLRGKLINSLTAKSIGRWMTVRPEKTFRKGKRSDLQFASFTFANYEFRMKTSGGTLYGTDCVKGLPDL